MKTRKLLAVLLCLCMVFSLIPMASAEDATLPLATEDEVVIYYTNDIHTYIDERLSYDTIAALKTATEEVAAGVLLVDAGDHVQGTAYGSMDKGETILDLMNAAGYDAATLGNHEFDYGMARTLELVEKAEFPYLSCNFYHEAGGVAGDPVLDAYTVCEVGDISVAFVGITTPESFTKSTPAYFQDASGNYIYGIAGGTDGSALYSYVQKAVDAASAEADYVIGLAHLGNDTSSKPWTSEEVIANTTGLDAVIDGHSHSTVPTQEVKDKAGNTVILTQTGSYLGSVGRMSITDDGIETGLISYVDIMEANSDGKETLVETYVGYTTDGKTYTRTGWTLGSDEAVAAIQNAWVKSVNDQLGEVIGSTSVTFDNYDASGNRLVRSQETNTGDFAADALYYLFDKTMDLDVDVAIMNGGGIRNKAITGELTYLSCKDIHTFGNVACLITVTGQQILDALEWGARDVPNAECGGFLQVSGMTYEIYSNVPSTVQKDEKGVWSGSPTGSYKVHNVQVLNKETGKYEPLDLNAKYNLAGYNYTLRDLGDGYAMFAGAVNVLDYVMEDYMVLANYVQSFPKDAATGLPTITAENSPYGKLEGAGRITINTDTAHPFTDVTEDKWYYDYVYTLYDAGIIKGMSATTYVPEGTLTRAQFAALLARVLGLSNDGGKNPFTDVAKNAWYYDEVLALAKAGVVEGVGGGRFAPEQAISREDIVTMLCRATKAAQASKEDLSTFTDAATVSDYAVPSMKWAVETGVVEGFPDNTLAPRANTTRAQAAAIVYRWMGLLELL